MLLIIVDFPTTLCLVLYHYSPANTGLLFLPYTSEALSFLCLCTCCFLYYILTSHITSFRDLSSVSSPPPKLSSSFWLHFLECQDLLSLSWWPLWPCTARGTQHSVGDNTGKASSWGNTEEVGVDLVKVSIPSDEMVCSEWIVSNQLP